MLTFPLPAVCRKKVTAAFDGRRLTSDGGEMLLAEAERRLGLSDKLAAVIGDGRDPTRVIHSLPDILRAHILAIACGWEDANDLDSLLVDQAFKVCFDYPQWSSETMIIPSKIMKALNLSR